MKSSDNLNGAGLEKQFSDDDESDKDEDELGLEESELELLLFHFLTCSFSTFYSSYLSSSYWIPLRKNFVLTLVSKCVLPWQPY